jgi:hypothetical protein
MLHKGNLKNHQTVLTETDVFFNPLSVVQTLICDLSDLGPQLLRQS